MNAAAPGSPGAGGERAPAEQHLLQGELRWDAAPLAAASPITWAFFLPLLFLTPDLPFQRAKARGVPVAPPPILPPHRRPTPPFPPHLSVLLRSVLPWALGSARGLWHPQRDTSQAAPVLLAGATTSHSRGGNRAGKRPEARKKAAIAPLLPPRFLSNPAQRQRLWKGCNPRSPKRLL